MTYPPYIRQKARQLRREKQLTLDEIVERLGLPKTTIWYWIEDIPFARPMRSPRQVAAQRRGNVAMQRKYRLLREASYEAGRRSFDYLASDPTFRDFVCLYIAEGYKRNRNVVSVANSDPAVIRVAVHWMRLLTHARLTAGLQYHADQDPEALRTFWSSQTAIPRDSIRLQRKSNSAGLAARSWRSKHGVLSVDANDTLFRARLQGWIDRLEEQWLNSA